MTGEMSAELMPKEVKVDPSWRRATLWASENTCKKGSGTLKAVDGKGQVEGTQRHFSLFRQSAFAPP